MGSPGSHESTWKHSAIALAQRSFSEWIGGSWFVMSVGGGKKALGSLLEDDIQSLLTSIFPIDFFSRCIKRKKTRLTLDVDVFSLITCIIHFSEIIYESILGERPQDTCQETITMSTKAHWAAHYWKAEWVWKPAFEVIAWGQTKQLPLCSTATGLHAFPFLHLLCADFHTAFTSNFLKLTLFDGN